MLETILKSSLFLPRFIQTGNSEPRKVHWVRNKEPTQLNQSQGGRKNDDSPKKKDARGYRDLGTIRLGEVSDAHRLFASQLIPSPYPGWIAPNYFCMIHLAQKRDDRPPAIFGRVKTCYPSDGVIQNIQEMELLFPGKDSKPDVVLLRTEDILQAQNKSVQSDCIRVKFLASPEDAADFTTQENLFIQHGFVPEFSTGYIDLLDINEHNHGTLPWLFVIGSRWFVSIPESIQPEIREKLTRLIHWNKLIFNYHPERLPVEIQTLNRELGLKAGFSDVFLYEPENPHQTAKIIIESFDRIFQQGVR